MDQDFALALAFDTSSHDFVRGVEVGRLWEELKTGEPVSQAVHATNAEMLLRMAEATGRPVWAQEADETWLVVHFGAPQETPED